MDRIGCSASRTSASTSPSVRRKTVWDKAVTFLVNRMGVAPSALPDSIVDSNGNPYYPSQIQAATALQEKMNVLAQTQQEDMIDLQTMVNRRDVAYSTASGVVRAMGQSMSQDAQNLI